MASGRRERRAEGVCPRRCLKAWWAHISETPTRETEAAWAEPAGRRRASASVWKRQVVGVSASAAEQFQM